MNAGKCAQDLQLCRIISRDVSAVLEAKIIMYNWFLSFQVEGVKDLRKLPSTCNLINDANWLADRVGEREHQGRLPYWRNVT